MADVELRDVDLDAPEITTPDRATPVQPARSRPASRSVDSERSLRSPRTSPKPEMTVKLDPRDVYGGFSAAKSPGEWAGPRRHQWQAFSRRVRDAWAVNYYWLFLLFLAVLTSFAAFGMDATAEALHYAVIQKVLRGGGGVGGFVALRVALTLLAVEATRVVSPIAAGSGIPEVKSVLAGFSLPGFLSLRTLVAKVGGVVLLLGAGLPIGKEGPFIHTAAILAESMLGLHYFRSHNATSGFRHQMLSAAAAVGVSAAFGAPIGGIMFSIEATATYYATSHYWGAFFAATVGAFASRELGYEKYAAFSPHFSALPYKHWEIVLFLLLSVACGALGGLFVKLFTAIVDLRRRCAALDPRAAATGPGKIWTAIIKQALGTNVGFSVLVAATSGLVLCGLVAAWIGDFAHLGTREVMDDLFSDGPLREADNGRLHRHSRWDQRTGGVGASLAYFCLFTYFFSACCIGLPASNGLVTPSFAIGAGIGRLAGEGFRRAAVLLGHTHDPLSPAGGYAIVGSAAFSVAVTGKLSIGVVISELTGQLSYSIPVLFACVIGLSVGSLVEIDVYSMIARLKALPHWPALSSAADFELTVGDVVDEETLEVVGVPLRSGAGTGATRVAVRDALAASKHAVVPVVADSQSDAFVGAVRTADLEGALRAADAESELDLTPLVREDWPRVTRRTTLSHACFKYALHQHDRIFVVAGGGRLVGTLDADKVGKFLQRRRAARGDQAHRGLAAEENTGVV